MTRPRHSLAMRKQAIDHLIAYCEKNVPETIIEAAQDAADFLKWAAKREIAMRELDLIERMTSDDVQAYQAEDAPF